MSLRLDCVNLLLTYNDPEEKISNKESLLDQLIKNFEDCNPTYGIASREKAPTTGMNHYHVYIKLGRRCQKKHGEEVLIVNTIRPNLEKVRNNIKAVIKYVMKGGCYTQYGTCPVNLKEEKLTKEKKAELMMNGNLEQLFLSGTLGAIDIIRAQKLKSIFQMNRKQKGYEKKLVLWFYGESGEGKTRLATELAEQFDSIYWLSNEGLKWFDGFENQEFAIIDDFRKSMLADWSYLLRLLDGYSLFVQIKGGFTTWNPKVIIITSPATPQQAFQWTNKEGEQEQWDKEEQLLRRLMYNNELQIYEFPLWEEKKEQIYQTIEDHLKRKRKTEEENMMPEEWSIIEPEGFITPG